MMRRPFSPVEPRLLAILLAVLVALVAGCASTPDTDESADSGMDSEFSDAARDARAREEEQARAQADRDAQRSARDIDIAPVYFDFDSYEIRDEFSSVLRRAAEAIRASNATIVIEGHCDERGSEEYNLALGERRANAVRSYLYNLGVPRDRMSTVSYGEAQPAVRGSGEAVWKLNRRAEFRVR